MKWHVHVQRGQGHRGVGVRTSGLALEDDGAAARHVAPAPELGRTRLAAPIRKAAREPEVARGFEYAPRPLELLGTCLGARLGRGDGLKRRTIKTARCDDRVDGDAKAAGAIDDAACTPRALWTGEMEGSERAVWAGRSTNVRARAPLASAVSDVEGSERALITQPMRQPSVTL